MSDDHQSQTLCFLKLYSVCPSLCFSLVSDASHSVVGMMFTQVKEDDGTHSHLERFSSTRARQLFFEKKIYGSLFRLSDSHILVSYEEEISNIYDNPLPEYFIINYLSPAYEPSSCVDMLRWLMLLSIMSSLLKY